MFDNDSVTNIAHQLGYFETIASVDVFGDLQPRIAAVTLDEVAAVARSVFRRQTAPSAGSIRCQSRDDNVTWPRASPLRSDKRCRAVR